MSALRDAAAFICRWMQAGRAGASPIGELCNTCIYLCSKALQALPIHVLLPAGRAKWLSSASPGLCSSQNPIRLQPHAAACPKSRMPPPADRGDLVSTMDRAAQHAAVCLQQCVGSTGSPCMSPECSSPDCALQLTLS